jgi:DNA-binding PadR family transcriptional regulator
VYSITDAGEAYLDFWAKALEQYRKAMDTFFKAYQGCPVPTDARRKKAGSADAAKT